MCHFDPKMPEIVRPANKVHPCIDFPEFSRSFPQLTQFLFGTTATPFSDTFFTHFLPDMPIKIATRPAFQNYFLVPAYLDQVQSVLRKVPERSDFYGARFCTLAPDLAGILKSEKNSSGTHNCIFARICTHFGQSSRAVEKTRFARR